MISISKIKTETPLPGGDFGIDTLFHHLYLTDLGEKLPSIHWRLHGE